MTKSTPPPYPALSLPGVAKPDYPDYPEPPGAGYPDHLELTHPNRLEPGIRPPRAGYSGG